MKRLENPYWTMGCGGHRFERDVNGFIRPGKVPYDELDHQLHQPLPFQFVSDGCPMELTECRNKYQYQQEQYTDGYRHYAFYLKAAQTTPTGYLLELDRDEIFGLRRAISDLYGNTDIPISEVGLVDLKTINQDKLYSPTGIPLYNFAYRFHTLILPSYVDSVCIKIDVHELGVSIDSE